MNLNYEESLRELEELLESMEKEDIELEVLLEKYKKSTELYNHLNKLLNDFKAEVKLVNADGELKDFLVDEEEI